MRPTGETADQPRQPTLSAQVRARRARWDRVGAAVVVVWLVWMGAWAMSEGGWGAPERIALTEDELKAGMREGEEWRGLYLKDEKVGYVRLRKARRSGGGWTMETRMELHLTVMKTRQRVQTDIQARMSEALVVEDFEADVVTGPARLEVEGVVEGTRVSVDLISGGSSQRQTIELAEPPRFTQALGPTLMRRKLKPGDVVAWRAFDPSALVERDTTIRYEGVETMTVMGHEVAAHRFAQEFGGSTLRLWTNAIGEVLREELPMGLVARRESAVEARYGVTEGAWGGGEDVVEAAAVTPDGEAFKAGAPQAELELSGLDFEGLAMDGGRQRWVPAPGDPERGTLWVQVEALGAHRALTLGALGDRAQAVPELAQALEAEPLIQSDHADIRAKARAIVGLKGDARGSERSALATAQQVSEWVHQQMKKGSVVGVPSALETLKTMRGDCNEHATLTVALLRALGVPARVALGVAWLASEGRFFYHAWVELGLDAGRWVAVDPTFGQFPADIGHLRFVVGGVREQVAMFRVIGHVEITHKGHVSTPPAR